MKNKKLYILILLALIIITGLLFFLNDTASEEELMVKEFYPQARKIELVKDISDDMFISINFPAVQRAYKVDGQVKAFVTSCVGYIGPIEILTAIDSETDTLLGIKVLSSEETLLYAGTINEDWFLTRFKNMLTDKYLNLVDLDKENPNDVVMITGATISSQAAVNSVNAAIGAYEYSNNNNEMARVPDVVPQEMWQKDLNSFAINWEGGSLRLNTDEIKEYDQVEMDVVEIRTTGKQTDLRVKGPILRDILDKEGVDLSSYAGIGVTGRDGYYTLIDKERLELNDIILAWEIDGKDIIKEEKPVRVVLPDEIGPYWVKMVSNIDLYEEISPKNIDKVHVFNALTRDIEPYYYEYYGSKDKSFEVGKILRKFDLVDQKGFFTMASNDGFLKNETISVVNSRYYIKSEGEGAPMNISPNFKLGMNVQTMTHFSTTKDAVIFPGMMTDVVRTKDIGGKTGLLLEDVLLTAGMRWTEEDAFKAVNADGSEVDLKMDEMLKSYLIDYGDKVILYNTSKEVVGDLLRIEKK